MADGLYITPFVDEKLRDVLARFGDKRQALLPILSILLREYGQLSEACLKTIANYTKLPQQIIQDTYQRYYPEKRANKGKYKIFVCINATCALKQSRDIVDYICTALRIEPGQTSPDGLFSLVTLQCLGGCFKPPTVKINGLVYQEMDKYKTKKLLDSLMTGNLPAESMPRPS